MSAEQSDSGSPMQGDIVATTAVQEHRFPVRTRYVSLRNTGPNTLWISLDNEHWIDVACGTSWDEKVRVDSLWYRTQTGRSKFAIVGVAMHPPNRAKGG